MCTVTPPGFSYIAAAMAVEQLASVFQHRHGYNFPSALLHPPISMTVTYVTIHPPPRSTSPTPNPMPNTTGAWLVSYCTNCAAYSPSSAIYRLQVLRMINLLSAAGRCLYLVFPFILTPKLMPVSRWSKHRRKWASTSFSGHSMTRILENVIGAG